MAATQLPTKSLVLNSLTREDTLTMIEGLSPENRAQVSEEWLAALRASASIDPWRHGFSMVHQSTGNAIGQCGFKGPPADGIVEIAYAVDAEHQSNGYATEAADALTNFAFAENVRTVRAHTLPAANASTRVLTKCGFHLLGEVIDPEDGLVWRWEKYSERPAPNP
jgi:ribosomal-protein-alanine N-acetyltransferase